MLELDVHIQTDGKAEAITRVLKDADKEPVMFPSVRPDIFQDYATRQMHTRQRTGVLVQYWTLLRESRSHMTTVLNGGLLYAIKFCAARMTPYHGAKSACHDGCAPRRTSDRGTKSAYCTKTEAYHGHRTAVRNQLATTALRQGGPQTLERRQRAKKAPYRA